MAFYTKKIVDHSGIWTQIVMVEGQHAHHLTNITPALGMTMEVTFHQVAILSQWRHN